MSENVKEDLESLMARVTERRRELLTGVVNRRTRHFCMVLEDLFDPHNISAVIRTAEVFGLQDVHVIEEDNAYSVNKSILKGSYKWMSIYLYKKRMLCMEKLRAKGYRIAVASTSIRLSTPPYPTICAPISLRESLSQRILTDIFSAPG